MAKFKPNPLADDQPPRRNQEPFYLMREWMKNYLSDDTIASMPTEPMLEAAAEAYRRSIAERDSSMWAVVCIFRALRRAALSASENGRSWCNPRTTKEPARIVMVQRRRPRREKPPHFPLVLPLLLTETMLAKASRRYQICKSSQCSAKRAVKLIYKVLRQAALEEHQERDHNEDLSS